MQLLSAAHFAARVLLLACLLQTAIALAGEPKLEKIATARLKDINEKRAFFNLGENPLTMDNDAIHGGFVLSHADSKKKATYIGAGTLAGYFGLTSMEALHLQIPLNFLFIGFEGEGEWGVTLEEPELQRWFAHMEFVEPHTRVPLDEVHHVAHELHAPAGSPEGAELEEVVESVENLPYESRVNYNYQPHVIELAPEVTKVIERALVANRRPLDPHDPRGSTHDQVDASHIQKLLDTLLEELHVANNAYNIVILNPSKDGRRPYGYRVGFSDEEVKALVEEVQEIPAVGGAPASKAHVEGALKQVLGAVDSWELPRSNTKFDYNANMVMEAEDWAGKVGDAMNTVEHARRVYDLNSTEGALAALREDMASMLDGQDPDDKMYAQALLKSRGDGMHENCLVDTWVGSGRSAFVDLTAGPFSWGPLIGGVGVRTPSNGPPSVEERFGHLPPNSDSKAGKDLENELEQMADARFAHIETEDTDESAEFIIAELDVYEMFALKHCHQRTRQIALCQQLESRVHQLEKDLQDLQQDPSKVIKRDHEWSIFGSDEHARNFSVATDRFMSELGSTISSALSHVVTPSTGAAPYHHHRKLSFLVYYVSNHAAYKPNSKDNFNEDILKRELRRLCLPGQEFQVSTQKLEVGDDAALSLAFANSLRTIVLPTVKPHGSFKARTRQYLDSAELSRHLLEVNRNKARHRERYSLNAASSVSAVLEVPVFLFSVDTESPLFIDKHYVAKSLPDMVLIVQNSQKEWESHLGCNDKVLKWNLRNPLKPALAAIAQHLGGILPTHVSFSPVHQAPRQSWLWATGGGPFANTNSGSGGGGITFSQFQIDALHRNYILSTLDQSMQMVNAAVEILENERTTEESFALFKKLPIDRLMTDHKRIMALYGEVVDWTHKMDYPQAVQLLPEIEKKSARFLHTAHEMKTAMHPVVCARKSSSPFTALRVAALGIAVVAFALFHVLRPRNLKPKVN